MNVPVSSSNSERSNDKIQAYQSHWIIDSQKQQSNSPLPFTNNNINQTSTTSTQSPVKSLPHMNPFVGNQQQQQQQYQQQPHPQQQQPHFHQQQHPQFQSRHTIQQPRTRHSQQSASAQQPAFSWSPQDIQFSSGARSNDSSISYAVDGSMKRKRGRRNKNPFSGQSITASQIQQSLNPKTSTTTTDSSSSLTTTTSTTSLSAQIIESSTSSSTSAHRAISRHNSISPTTQSIQQLMWNVIDESTANQTSSYVSPFTQPQHNNNTKNTGKLSINYIVN